MTGPPELFNRRSRDAMMSVPCALPALKDRPKLKRRYAAD